MVFDKVNKKAKSGLEMLSALNSLIYKHFLLTLVSDIHEIKLKVN
jgi:hypothetical protein